MTFDTTQLEGELAAFAGDPAFQLADIFSDQRFPNLVVALDGTVLATWGTTEVGVRRSEDGGLTWGPAIPIGPGIHAGGATVDEGTGDVLVFVHSEHPPKDRSLAARTMYRSMDAGRTWVAEDAAYGADGKGHVPSLHMAECGITLRHGERAGRLLRPARVYASPQGYNTAIYSDDHGRSWTSSAPFPVNGTGEGCVAELSDGRVYYSSRRHWFGPGEPLSASRLHGWSRDGGATWGEVAATPTLPDGPRYRGIDKRGANYNGHFGMAAGLLRLPVAGRDILVYSNADHDGHERVGLTVWLSFDGGATWPVKRLVDGGPSAYSSLGAGRPGTASEGWIYLQYEERGAGGRIAQFNLSWILRGAATGDGEMPTDLG